jgi:hypothetical protein
MYEVTSNPLVNLTRHTLRNAEFGFFGVVVYTRVQTPLFWGLDCNAGTSLLAILRFLGFRTNWLILAIALYSPVIFSETSDWAGSARDAS